MEKKAPATANTFVEALRKTHDLTTTEAREIVRTFLKTMEESLQEDRDILFNRIGKIVTYTQEERVSIIPKTGQRILLHERKLLKWETSHIILELLNEKAGNPRTYTELTIEEAQEYIEKHQKRKK